MCYVLFEVCFSSLMVFRLVRSMFMLSKHQKWQNMHVDLSQGILASASGSRYHYFCVRGYFCFDYSNFIWRDFLLLVIPCTIFLYLCIVKALKIQVIKGKVEEIELPEKADILISEPMGEFDLWIICPANFSFHSLMDDKCEEVICVYLCRNFAFIIQVNRTHVVGHTKTHVRT